MKIGSVVLNMTEGGQEIPVFFQEDGKGRGVGGFHLVGATWARVGVPIGTRIWWAGSGLVSGLWSRIP